MIDKDFNMGIGGTEAVGSSVLGGGTTGGLGGQFAPTPVSDTCPNCGYCKHCGRGREYYPVYPNYPVYPSPVYPYYPWTYTTTGPTIKF